MIEKNTLITILDKTFRNAGFAKKSNSWYRSEADAIVVLNLQKSDFGNYYYLNVGVSLMALSTDVFPKENHCHIQLRADSLLNDDLITLNRALNLDEGDESDLAEFVDLMKGKFLPIITEFHYLTQLREHYRKSTFRRALVLMPAKEMLDAPSA